MQHSTTGKRINCHYPWLGLMAVILGLASLLWIRSPVHTMWALQHQLPSALVVISGFLFDFALFLVPGLAVAKLIFHRRPQMNPIYLVAVIVTTGAGLGYVSFWAFFFSMPLGRMLSYVVYTVSLGNLLLTSRSRDTSKQIIKAVGAPFFYSALAGLAYLCFFFLFVDPLSSGVWSPKTSIATWYAGVRFFDQIHPGDNQIPLIFADRIYDRGPLRPFCCGDWLSSDRPPLQSGIVLLERPTHVIPKLELDYELLTAGLQCLWICGVWCLLRSLGASDLITRRLLAFLIFSGFLFLNSVYTWPKLLSAAFLFFVISIIIAIIRRNQPATALESVVAAACVGLTLLAHPGSVFSLCSIALLMLYFRRLFPVRHIGLSFATLCMLILPWSAYQKFVDPPGNRLLKTHLASVIPIDNRSTWQALRDSYRSLTFVQIIQFKWENVKFLAGHKPLDLFGLDCFNFRKGMRLNRAATENSRFAQEQYIWNAVGLANAGWLAALLIGLCKKRRRAVIRWSGWLIIGALVNFSFWCLALFGPHGTFTTHASFADIILLSLGLLGFVLALPGYVYFTLFTLQLFNFFVVWVWSPPFALSHTFSFITPVLQLPMLAFGTLFTLLLLWCFGKEWTMPILQNSTRYTIDNEQGLDTRRSV